MTKNFKYEFARPSVTATIVLLTPKLEIVLGKRTESTEAFPGYFSLPGGFLDCRIDPEDSFTGLAREGETVEQTAIRETFEETNITIFEQQLALLAVHSDPTLDPRCHVVNVVYLVRLTEEQAKAAKPGDDLTELEFRHFRESFADLAFNHEDIVKQALLWV